MERTKWWLWAVSRDGLVWRMQFDEGPPFGPCHVRDDVLTWHWPWRRRLASDDEPWVSRRDYMSWASRRQYVDFMLNAYEQAWRHDHAPGPRGIGARLFRVGLFIGSIYAANRVRVWQKMSA